MPFPAQTFEIWDTETMESNCWKKLLYYPLMWLLVLLAAIKRGVCHVLGWPVTTNSFFFDGLGATCREIKENAANAHALTVLYNFPFKRPKTFGQAVDNFWLNSPNACAVRNRKKMVKQMIADCVREIATAKHGPVHIMSLACGSAEAVLEAMAITGQEGLEVKCLLVDVSWGALYEATAKATTAGLQNKVQVRRANLANPEKVAQVASGFCPDIIEIVGLLDYLTDAQAISLFDACRQVLPPWGQLFTCNILPNGERVFLEQVIGWRMTYRTPSQLHRLLVNSGFGRQGVEVVNEPLNIHAVARCRGGMLLRTSGLVPHHAAVESLATGTDQRPPDRLRPATTRCARWPVRVAKSLRTRGGASFSVSGSPAQEFERNVSLISVPLGLGFRRPPCVPVACKHEIQFWFDACGAWEFRRYVRGNKASTCRDLIMRKSLLLLVGLLVPFAGLVQAQSATGKVRTYYVAADEVNWDYAPSGRDEAMGHPFDEVEKPFVESAPHRIGRVYKKAIYREYTDASFSTLKPRAPEDQYLGLVGPILRGEVGDTIKVVFKNNAIHPFSMHPHGVFYEKHSEGADYNDGTSGTDKEDGGVPPGATHTYMWQIPERAGPGPNDPSSVFWLYHSHTDELRDVASGLFGGIIVTRRGGALPNGRPKGVDHEFVTIFIAVNENESWYLEDNIRAHCTDPKGVNRTEFRPVTADGMVTPVVGTGFVDTNVKWSIDGYIFGNMPMMTMKQGQHVRWYVATLGDFNNAHTPHWHGNTVLVGGQRTDVVSVLPAQMITADMVPDAPGIWLYHCHISDHMMAGMVARYKVEP